MLSSLQAPSARGAVRRGSKLPGLVAGRLVAFDMLCCVFCGDVSLGLGTCAARAGVAVGANAVLAPVGEGGEVRRRFRARNRTASRAKTDSTQPSAAEEGWLEDRVVRGMSGGGRKGRVGEGAREG